MLTPSIRSVQLLLPALLLLSASSSTGDTAKTKDSWPPFQDCRIVSTTGQHYAVLRRPRKKKPGSFELVRRRDAMPRISAAIERTISAQIEAMQAGKPKVDVSADPKDRVLAKGALSELPMDAKVTDKPVGIVLFDKYANVGYGRVLSFLDASGKLSWSRNLKDLFGRRPRGSSATVSSLWWSAVWGVDEVAGIAWALSLGGECRTVSLKTGRITTPKPELVLALCLDTDPAEWGSVLRALHSRRDFDFSPFLVDLQTIAKRADLAVETRMFAALFCRRTGDKTDYRDLFTLGSESDRASAVDFAALYLVEISSDEDAIEPLIARLNEMPRPLSGHDGSRLDFASGFETWAVVDVFRRLGPFGLARLRQMFEAEGTTPVGVMSAAVIWWKLGNQDLPLGLKKLIRKGPASEALLAIDILIGVHPKGLRELLLDLASVRTANDARLALYFLDRPQRDAIPHLKRMLLDDRNDGADLIVIRTALPACERR